jgi:hypothetical protein
VPQKNRYKFARHFWLVRQTPWMYVQSINIFQSYMCIYYLLEYDIWIRYMLGYVLEWNQMLYVCIFLFAWTFMKNDTIFMVALALTEITPFSCWYEHFHDNMLFVSQYFPTGCLNIFRGGFYMTWKLIFMRVRGSQEKIFVVNFSWRSALMKIILKA